MLNIGNKVSVTNWTEIWERSRLEIVGSLNEFGQYPCKVISLSPALTSSTNEFKIGDVLLWKPWYLKLVNEKETYISPFSGRIT